MTTTEALTAVLAEGTRRHDVLGNDRRVVTLSADQERGASYLLGFSYAEDAARADALDQMRVRILEASHLACQLALKLKSARIRTVLSPKGSVSPVVVEVDGEAFLELDTLASQVKDILEGRR